MYIVFARTFWKENPSWPNGLEPHFGRKTTIARCSTAAEAQDIARRWNATHKPGRLSRKAEYTEK